MNSTSTQPHAGRKHLLVGVGTAKRGKQRWVDVDDAPAPLLDEPAAHDTHEAGQADQLDAGDQHGLVDELVVVFPLLEATVWDDLNKKQSQERTRKKRRTSNLSKKYQKKKKKTTNWTELSGHSVTLTLQLSHCTREVIKKKWMHISRGVYTQCYSISSNCICDKHWQKNLSLFEALRCLPFLPLYKAIEYAPFFLAYIT